MSNGNGPAIGPGGIRFYDRYAPALPGGDYLLNVVQRANPLQTGVDECYATSQAFSVAASRFALAPADIYSTFPPNEAIGTFDQFLPHVVFSRPELPWELFFLDGSPWLALLVFGAGEEIGGAPALLEPTLTNASERTLSAPISAEQIFEHAQGDGVLWPDLAREFYEQELDKVTASVVDLSPAAFTQLVPSKSSLGWLAHARRIHVTGKSDRDKTASDGWYSVVVASRLPAPPGAGGAPARSIAHLVSIEGFEPYVDGSRSLPAATKRVRMIAFASWTFSCLPEGGASFAELANGLLVDGDGTRKQTTFALPVPPLAVGGQPAAPDAWNALMRGYVPLSYATRQGEATFAWYRGPLSPVPVAPFVRSAHQTGPRWQPFGTASAAAAYDKQYGVFDLSYAVAWDTGRLMALADGPFAQAVTRWHRNGRRLIDLVLERRAQVPALAGLNPNDPDPIVERSLLDLLEASVVGDEFIAHLVTQLSGELAPKLSVSTPSPHPPQRTYMQQPPPRADTETIAELLAEDEVRDAVRTLGGQGLAAIVDELARRWLLVDVPFETLVAHPDLLPPESIRFFYLDHNWLDAMIEGALSIGIESSRERLFQDLMRDLIEQTTFDSLDALRKARLPPTGNPSPIDRQALTGLLLRSALVSGWAGLEIHAYARAATGYEPDPAAEIAPLRFDHLGGDLLLCLWPEVPAVVSVDEPHEGIAFGFEDPPTGQGRWIYPRSMDAAAYGAPLCSGAGPCKYALDAVAAGIVDSTTRLVNLGALAAKLQATLPGAPTLAPRDIAVQLVRVPEQAVFAREVP